MSIISKIITSSKTTQRDERGMASILITMVIMTVIALVVLGFAIVSRREQRLTLDRQLNTQAFYAAESGVNDTYKLIAGSLANSAPSGTSTAYNWSRNGKDFTTCTPLAGIPEGNRCFTDLPSTYVYGWDTYKATYSILGIPATALNNTATLKIGYSQWNSGSRPNVPQSYTAFQVRITMPGTAFAPQVVSLPIAYGQSDVSLSTNVSILMPATTPTSIQIEWLNDEFAPASPPIPETDANLKIENIGISGGIAASAPTDLVKNTCANTGTYLPLVATSVLTSSVSYNCVLVDPAPLKFEKKDITDSNAWITPVYTDKNPDTMIINWKPRSAVGNALSQCPNISGNKYNFPAATPAARPCQYPVLRVDIVDAQAFNGTTNTMMNDKLSTYYLQPYAGGTSVVSVAALNNRIGSSDANSPQVIPVGDCDNATTGYGSCTVEIKNAGAGQRFSTKAYVRITSLYGASDASIITKQGTEVLKMYGGQVMLDVTGKAQDVSRRIQVRIPADQTGTAFTSAFAVQGTGSLCKRYSTYPNYFVNDAAIPSSLYNVSNPDQMCQ